MQNTDNQNIKTGGVINAQAILSYLGLFQWGWFY